MIFQYNPADFFLETTVGGELLVTVCRPGYVAPKIRYNIHDLGHVIRFPALRTLLAEFDVDITTLDASALDLPVLLHYGRSDLSVSWYGCKIPPADVQETLFRMPAFATGVDAFRLHTFDDADGDKRLVIALEQVQELPPPPTGNWTTQFFDTLAAVNQDFRESRRMAPATKPPRLELHPQGTGPFDGADIRIKRQYVLQGAG